MELKPQISLWTSSLGGDPEAFFEQDGEIIGSEHVLPERDTRKYNPKTGRYESTGKKRQLNSAIIQDGIQVEFNLYASGCRALIGDSTCYQFGALKDHLNAHFKDVRMSWRSTVQISQKEFDRVCEDSKKLGCNASLNIHDSTATLGVPDDYPIRSAGGHIHIGNPALDPNVFIRLCDAIVGNTCVMIDRGEDQKIRRQVYGRAGEYRRQPHGWEYRTLSNFWLRNYKLMCLAMGLVRLAESIERGGEKLWGPLMESLDFNQIVRAINENDPDLARKNWEVVRDFLKDRLPHLNETDSTSFSLGPNVLDAFDRFLEMDSRNRFTMDPMTHWTEQVNGSTWCHENGWETYILNFKDRKET